MPSSKPVRTVRGSSTCAKSGGAPLNPSPASICSAYKNIREAFKALIARNYSISNPAAQSNLFGQAIRVAFHDSAEIDITQRDKMGPDGCLSDTPDNKGLLEPTSLILSVLNPLWQANCDKISRADFWVLFAKLSIEQADPTNVIRIPFQYGRVDTIDCSAGAGRLPDPQLGMGHVQQVFGRQMGFSLPEIGEALPFSSSSSSSR